MTEPQKLQKPPRKDCIYYARELQQIEPYREKYRKASKPERLQIMKSEILPAMFNYWEKLQEGPKDEAESRDWARVMTIDFVQKLCLTQSDSNCLGGVQTTGECLKVLGANPIIGNPNAPTSSGGIEETMLWKKLPVC